MLEMTDVSPTHFMLTGMRIRNGYVYLPALILNPELSVLVVNFVSGNTRFVR